MPEVPVVIPRPFPSICGEKQKNDTGFLARLVIAGTDVTILPGQAKKVRLITGELHWQLALSYHKGLSDGAQAGAQSQPGGPNETQR